MIESVKSLLWLLNLCLYIDVYETSHFFALKFNLLLVVGRFYVWPVFPLVFLLFSISEPQSPQEGDTSQFLSRINTIWKGFINMQSVAKFVTKAYPVSGSFDYLSEVRLWCTYVFVCELHLELIFYSCKEWCKNTFQLEVNFALCICIKPI